MSAPRPSGRSRGFQPRASLALLYFVALFFGFALIGVAPALLAAFRALPAPAPGAEVDLELATRVARDAARGRLWVALLLAALATGLGARAGVLPGLRRGAE